MKRRQFIKASVASSVLIGIGGAGLWLNDGVDKSRLTIAAVLAKIEQLQAQPIETSGVWSLNQILEHCAQSVEYSMTGFPEHKSAVFKNTVGKLAFSAFATKGEMVHALDEVIPGAPLIAIEDEEVQSAFTRLIVSLNAFQQYKGELAPHFAYGVLSKPDYALAHAMHFYNHLTEISQV